MARLEILHESRRSSVGNVEDVIENEDLAIDVRPGPDTDHRYLERSPDRLAEFARHAFEQDDVRAGILQPLPDVGAADADQLETIRF